MHLAAGLAAQQPLAFIHAGVARRLAVDGADVITRHQAGLGRRRSVARRDYPQVILAGQFDAGLPCAAEIALLEHFQLCRVKKRAVRVETVREAVHRAVHHLVDVDVFDVVVEDQRHHVFKGAQVLIAVLARDGVAHEATDDGEGDDCHRHHQHEDPPANFHN